MVVQPSEKLSRWCEEHYGENIKMPLELQREKAILCYRVLPNDLLNAKIEGKEQLHECIKKLRKRMGVFTCDKNGFIIGLQPFANEEDKKLYKEIRRDYPQAFADSECGRQYKNPILEYFEEKIQKNKQKNT